MAEFKVTMKHPHFPSGMEIEIDGVGAVKNGESIQVTQGMQDSWSAANQGLDLKKSLAQNGAVEFNGKDKLMDDARSAADIDVDEQAARQENGGEK
jgi:hypothetical protein